jgi:hypothetical protein
LAWCTREGYDVSNVLNTCCHHDQTLKAETEPAVGNGSVFTELAVPPVGFLVKLAVGNALIELFEVLLSGGPSDELSNAGYKDIHGLNSLVVIVKLHVESLNVLGIVVKNDGAVEDLLGEMSLVLRSEVDTPVELVLKLDLALLDFLLEDLNSVCVGNSSEWSVNDLL